MANDSDFSGRIGAASEPAALIAARSDAAAQEQAERMPLPTDPRTIFLGGLFFLAVMATLSIAASLVLPVVFAIVLKLLLQPLVRVLDSIGVPRGLGALAACLLVVLVFGGLVSALSGPAEDWARRLPEALPKLEHSVAVLRGPIGTDPLDAAGFADARQWRGDAARQPDGRAVQRHRERRRRSGRHAGRAVLPAGHRRDLPAPGSRDPARTSTRSGRRWRSR